MPHVVHVNNLSDRGRRCLALAPHCAQSMVVYAGCARCTVCLRLWPISIRARLVAPMAASAALRAMVDLARNRGLRSSTAIWSWSGATALAHLRAVSWRCGASACPAVNDVGSRVCESRMPRFEAAGTGNGASAAAPIPDPLRCVAFRAG